MHTRVSCFGLVRSWPGSYKLSTGMHACMHACTLSHTYAYAHVVRKYLFVMLYVLAIYMHTYTYIHIVRKYVLVMLYVHAYVYIYTYST